MTSTRASISKASKRPKINIIPPKQLFVDLTHDNTKTPSPTLQLSSPSTPNAPSKTPLTKDTSSSSIDYIPKSPTSSTSLLPNGYLNSPTSPPLRVSPPPPTQENVSMDITLTLSPITPLDVQFDTPSPSPPIFGHPFSWNLLEAHRDSCTARAISTNTVNTVNPPNGTASTFSTGEPSYPDYDDSQIPPLEDIYENLSHEIFNNASYDDEGAVVDFTNFETIVNVSPIPTSRVHTIHPKTQILGDPTSAVQTRSKVNNKSRAHALIEPKKISEALEDESWVDAMQEELLQFKIQKVWILVDLPFEKKAIGTKWVYRNKKDERGAVVRNKARLVAQGHRQEERIDYDEDPKYPKKVYKVVKDLYGLHQAPRAWYAILSTFLLKNGYRRGIIDKTLFIKKDKNDIMLVQVYVDDIIFGSTKKSWCDEFEALMKSRFQMSSMGERTFFLGLQVKQKEDGIFISQDKYVAEILKKFDFMSVKTASTPIETQKPLTKDKAAADVDVHLYRSLIGSLMYLTTSRPDIMFAVCACSRFQEIHNMRLSISWQETYILVVQEANNYGYSTTEAEYVAAANCCGRVLWIQNQMLDYGFNFMNTKIYIDNESTICIVKNLVFHSKTKHIEIRHHFIRDAYEKKLIQVFKIHTDDNVADLLTKAFDASRFTFLIVNIGMINQ
ncbi:putative ribonuclease H-like domain-containing protein [Tanacetum coccineum]